VSEELLTAAAAATVEARDANIDKTAAGTLDTDICVNCGAALAGPFCHACGQKRTHLHKPFWELTEDFLHSVVHYDGRLWQTLRALFFKPGQLTLDWIAGRQVRHVPPIRLFIFTTLFLILSLAVSDVALVRIDGHLGFKSSADGKQPRFQFGACDDDKPGDDCVTGKLKQDIDSDMRADVFRLKPTQKLKTAALDDNLLNEIDSAEGQKVVGTLFDFVNRAARDPGVLNKAISGSITTFVLLATPIMAVLLKLFYIRRKKYLAEHVFFALHVHTFFFASLLVCILLVWISRGMLGGWAMAGLLWLAYSVYFLMALKRTYGQSWRKTVLKSVFVTGFYVLILISLGTVLLSRYLVGLASNVST
jgi:hypothetical protein